MHNIRKITKEPDYYVVEVAIPCSEVGCPDDVNLKIREVIRQQRETDLEADKVLDRVVSIICQDLGIPKRIFTGSPAKGPTPDADKMKWGAQAVDGHGVAIPDPKYAERVLNDSDIDWDEFHKKVDRVFQEDATAWNNIGEPRPLVFQDTKVKTMRPFVRGPIKVVGELDIKEDWCETCKNHGAIETTTADNKKFRTYKPCPDCVRGAGQRITEKVEEVVLGEYSNFSYTEREIRLEKKENLPDEKKEETWRDRPSLL